MIFKTVQSDLLKHNGKRVIKKAPLDESKYDKEDVGQMYEVVLSDKTVLEVFEDELFQSFDNFDGFSRIKKAHARKLFNEKKVVYIGGNDRSGEGAIWDISGFISDELVSFDDIVLSFEKMYCRGDSRILYTCFYVKE